jgi:DNA replication ATP-dependent helicase Dna2
MYGLKGKIDVSAEVRMAAPNAPAGPPQLVPLEAKTGKNFQEASHAAQTLLYSLLLEDRHGKYPAPRLISAAFSIPQKFSPSALLLPFFFFFFADVRVVQGLLLYIKEGAMSSVPTTRKYVIETLHRRNYLASFLYSKGSLPDIIRNPAQCKKCFKVDACMVYHKVRLLRVRSLFLLTAKKSIF